MQMSFDILGTTNAEARFSKIHIRKVYACLAGIALHKSYYYYYLPNT